MTVAARNGFHASSTIPSPYFTSLNGVPQANTPMVSVHDVTFQRCYGVFEVVPVLENGHVRALDLHLDRLERSAQAIDMNNMPSRSDLKEWIVRAAREGGGGPAGIRLMITQGCAENDAIPQVIVMWLPVPAYPESFSLMPMLAPWHAAGRSGWPAIKWLSYGPNIRSTSMAKKQGYTDALLLSNVRPYPDDDKMVDGEDANDEKNMLVLDGPSFAVGWFGKTTDSGVPCLQFPCWKTMGLLQSITQELTMRAARDTLGWKVEEGAFTLSQMLESGGPVFVVSSTRGIIPVHEIGEHKLEPTKQQEQALIDPLRKALLEQSYADQDETRDETSMA